MSGYKATAASLRACTDPQKRHAADVIDELAADRDRIASYAELLSAELREMGAEIGGAEWGDNMHAAALFFEFIEKWAPRIRAALAKNPNAGLQKKCTGPVPEVPVSTPVPAPDSLHEIAHESALRQILAIAQGDTISSSESDAINKMGAIADDALATRMAGMKIVADPSVPDGQIRVVYPETSRTQSGTKSEPTTYKGHRHWCAMFMPGGGLTCTCDKPPQVFRHQLVGHVHRFANECGKEIEVRATRKGGQVELTIKGPDSISTNTVTVLEAHELRRALDAVLVADTKQGEAP